MTKNEFKVILSAIDRAASQQGIDLADSSSAFTLWSEMPKGSGEYRSIGKADDLVQAMNLAGAQDAVIRRTDTGWVQLIVRKDQQWFYS
jgi:hypothetical protein